MKFLNGIAILCISCVLLACNTSKKSTNSEDKSYNSTLFNQEALLDRVEELSSDQYEGRLVGTDGSKKAQEFIKSEFLKHNVKPFTLDFNQFFKTKTGTDSVLGNNLLGLIEGAQFANKYIVISAHYDHVGVRDSIVYNGADDNASGVSALIALAEYLSKNPPKHSVILAAFDNEEYGLQGAKYFVNKAKEDSLDVVFNINMDMISRSKKNEIYAVGQLSQKELQPLISGLELPADISIPTGHEGNDGTRNWLYASDHAPFYESGIPVLYFGVDDHPDYHQPSDDFENIDKDFYVKAVEVIIKTFNAVDSFYK